MSNQNTVEAASPADPEAWERLTDERDDIRTRLLDALEQTGWIEPEMRDRIDPLGAAVLAADALSQEHDGRRATMQLANNANTRLRTLLLDALDIPDDDRTSLFEYVQTLVAQRDAARGDR